MSKQTYIIRPLKLAVMPTGAAVYDERTTFVEIADEAAGEFITISQENGHGKDGEQKLAFDAEELPKIIEAVNQLTEEINKHAKNGGGK